MYGNIFGLVSGKNRHLVVIIGHAAEVIQKSKCNINKKTPQIVHRLLFQTEPAIGLRAAC
jgi:hypothetical protein